MINEKISNFRKELAEGGVKIWCAFWKYWRTSMHSYMQYLGILRTDLVRSVTKFTKDHEEIWIGLDERDE